jgi:hypothetical protein
MKSKKSKKCSVTPIVTHMQCNRKTSVAEHIQTQTKKFKMEHRMQLRIIQVATNIQLKYK